MEKNSDRARDRDSRRNDETEILVVHEFFDKLQELLTGNVPFVSVMIVDSIGSVPQNAGSKMLVTNEGLYFGTVGGGKVEKRAIEEAQVFLRSGRIAGEDPSSEGGSEQTDEIIRVGDAKTKFVNWSLNKDIGMTCGGSVKLYFEVFNTNLWNIVVFGAGHCSNALIGLLVNLDCRVTCFDTRPEWLERLPQSAKLKKVHADDLPSAVADLSDNSFITLMTMGHTTDKPILLEILRQWTSKRFPYLGVIGSKAKAARLMQDIDEAGLPSEYKKLFRCPMGLAIGNNHPQEIAISIVAELIQERDRLSP
ncbi:MAG: XdhC family protein [Candidatus Obscuribacterales bacterium]|nr:XdhC family protein [Candidatus Obscuribacterales bacterium]